MQLQTRNPSALHIGWLMQPRNVSHKSQPEMLADQAIPLASRQFALCEKCNAACNPDKRDRNPWLAATAAYLPIGLDNELARQTGPTEITATVSLAGHYAHCFPTTAAFVAARPVAGQHDRGWGSGEKML
jgi:hypothetical protein